METSIRDAQFLNVYGVGAMIDVDQQVVMPIWDIDAGVNPVEISEPILVQRIRARGFPRLTKLLKLPMEKDNDQPPEGCICSVIFPQWMYCPKCGRLNSYWNWRNGWQDSLCNVSGTYPGKNRPIKDVLSERFEKMPMCCHCRMNKIKGIPRLIPANYVSICEHGHIDDFPWDQWCHLGHPHASSVAKELYFDSHSELNKQKVRCKCGASRSMAALFGRDALESTKVIRCSGAMPWKGYNTPASPFHSEPCDAIPQAVQRNATNIRFPRTMAAFSVPLLIEADKIEVSSSAYWQGVKKLAHENKSYDQLVGLMVGDLNISEERVKFAIQCLLKDGVVALSDQDYEKCEYEAFLNALSEPTKYFQVEKIAAWQGMPTWLTCLNKVVRLREISVPLSFTRVFASQDSVPTPDPIHPEATKHQIVVKEQLVAPAETDKLYACEGFGEGVFLSFSRDALTAWYNANEKKLDQEYCDLIRGQRHGNIEKKQVLLMTSIHTLVHCLMIQMSVESGYALTALRERIYCSTDGEEYFGALIYTTSSDKCGTLGGVSRYADASEFTKLLRNALNYSEHCDNDPLCSEHPSGRSSKSSCFACTFLPETSCAIFNQWLDRKLLRNVASVQRPWLGLFNDGVGSSSVASQYNLVALTEEDPVPGCSYLLRDGREIWGYNALDPIDKKDIQGRIDD